MKLLTVTCLLFLLFFGMSTAAGRTASGGSSSVRAATTASTSVEDNNTFNLSDFGAVGDGVANDGPALQAALNAIAAAGGGNLLVPAGRYAINTPVQRDFSGLAASVTILGVESLTPVPPRDSPGNILTRGLDLSSEFAPRTGELMAIHLTGLQNLLIKDITFIGTPDVVTDASITLALNDIWDATIRHCEFYGLSSLGAGGAIIQAVRSHLHLEQSVFLGSTTNSGLNTSVVQNIEWKGIAVVDTLFVDYGQRPELYGKLGLAAPASWVNVGNVAALENNSSRREAVIRNVFFDEGALAGFSSHPNRNGPSAPIDLVYVSGLYMNVSNLGTSGNYIQDTPRVLIENAHYGWSHHADAAVNLVGVGNAILDQLECVDAANRILANATTGKLTVINSIYTTLDSQSPATRVITTETSAEDPVQYVRQQFETALGREPDAAAHFYWSDLLLQCGDDAQCLNAKQAAFQTYLETAPTATFSISGTVTNESGAGLSGVSITLSGSQSVVTQTRADGKYIFDKLPTSGVYTVRATSSNYIFSPELASYSNPSGNQVRNFTGTLANYIYGRVTAGGVGISGVTISLNGSQANTTSDLAGDYSFRVPAESNYTITPVKTGNVFSPLSVTFNNLSHDQVANFEATGRLLNFSATSYNSSEAARTIAVTVTRTGDTSNAAEVVYSAVDGSAQQGSDLIPVIGRLSFSSGEASKTFIVLITDDSYLEGNETLTLELGDAIGGNLGAGTAILTIADNDNEGTAANPIDNAQFFVRQQYRDFLNRTADAEGLAFWSDQILSCETDAACIADRRISVSAAFFLSIEFQETGFLVYRLYKASFGQPPQHVNEFLLDTRTIGQGVVVNAPGWQDLLEANKLALIQDFVERTQFSVRYPLNLTPVAFVNQLNANAGGVLSTDDVAAAVAEFGGTASSEEPGARARVLRRVAESQVFTQRELNPAFVLQQYFGYLQRNPYDPPNVNLDGYNFWLNKLNEFNGDFRRAEMVKAFLVSGEYRARFGAP